MKDPWYTTLISPNMHLYLVTGANRGLGVRSFLTLLCVHLLGSQK